MTEQGTLPRLLAAASRALGRLGDDVSTPGAVLALLAELGIATPIAPGTLLALAPRVATVASRAESLVTAIADHGEDSLDAVAASVLLAEALAQTFAQLADSAEGIRTDLAAYPDVLARLDLAQVAVRLLEHVLLAALAAEVPAVYDVLLLVGVVDETIRAPLDEADDVTLPHIERRLRFDRLAALGRDPGALMHELYGWGEPAFDHARLLGRALHALRAAGVPVDLIDAPLALGARAETAALAVPLVQEVTSAGWASLALDVAAIGEPGADPPPGLVAGLVASGVARLAFTLREGLDLALEVNVASGAPVALEMRPGKRPTLRAGGIDVTGAAELTWRRADGERQPIVTAGGWLRLDIDAVRARVGVHAVTGGRVEPEVEIGVVDAMFQLGGGHGDGFLQRILPADGIRLPFDLAARWSPSTGVSIVGGPATSAEFRVRVPLDLSIAGVIDVNAIDLVAARVVDHGIAITATTDVGIHIGPVDGVIEEIGLRVRIDPSAPSRNLGVVDVGIGFAFPKGLGASVEAGPVSGGGYLFFDPDEQRYAGALQLSVNIVRLTAIGLLTTKLPDGSQGFSLLVIITAEFPPIQLGYGFTLNGVGGLVGINRTMRTDPLRDGVRDGSLDAVLFPRDVVAQAQRLVAALGAIFPPAAGRYVFGPMVKLGWGPNALIDIEVALVLELPSPLRLAILGRVRVALPTKEEAVVDLRLDVVGILDFDRAEASVDASLVDSRIAVFTLTGDMAFRLGWGSTKMFALAVGGFHPSFAPPPGFPTLRRLAIALGNTDNLRVRLETYLAITSNTFQLGAKLDVYAAYDTFLGRFSAAAYLGFDTLLQIDPLHLQASLSAGIDIQRDGTPLLHAQLLATLDGPSPWRIAGFAEFEFLGRHRIDFEVTVGEPQQAPLGEVDLDTLLIAELGRPEVWIALPPAGAAVVTLRDATPADGAVMHPLGGLGVHQRLVPFDKVVSRFGTARVARGPVTYSLRALTVGAGTAPPVPVLDDFAPAQFESLTDDEKLARPAFEAMPAGGTAPLAALQLPNATTGTPPGAVVEPGYREMVVDEPAARSRAMRRRHPQPMREALRDALHARAPNGFAAPTTSRIGVRPERWVVASGDTLAAIGEPGDATSAAQARDALRAVDPTGATAVVAAVHEAT